MMTSNRPLEDWGKLIGDVPAATGVPDRFLHRAEILTIEGRSYRLKDRARGRRLSRDIDVPAAERRAWTGYSRARNSPVEGQMSYNGPKITAHFRPAP